MSPRGRRAGAVDWASVREKVQRLEAAGETAALSTDETRAILAERARVLSQVHIDPRPSDSLDVLTFAVGVERYAVEMKYVREVARLLHFTRVPGAPDFIAGVTNYRGQILCVMTLAGILGIRSGALTDLSTLIVIGIDKPEFGVLADRTDAIVSLGANEILPPSGFISAAARDYLLGVTRAAVLVINGAHLLQDSRLFVNERETPSGQDAPGEPTPC